MAVGCHRNPHGRGRSRPIVGRGGLPPEGARLLSSRFAYAALPLRGPFCLVRPTARPIAATLTAGRWAGCYVSGHHICRSVRHPGRSDASPRRTGQAVFCMWARRFSLRLHAMGMFGRSQAPIGLPSPPLASLSPSYGSRTGARTLRTYFAAPVGRCLTRRPRCTI